MSGKKLVATVVVHIAIRSDRKEINNPVENKSSGWIIAGFIYGGVLSHGGTPSSHPFIDAFSVK